MIRRCELTETAAKLSLQLEAYRIPDDFEAAGEDWQVIARIRDEYTNYRKLAKALPPCPDSCPTPNDAAGLTPGPLPDLRVRASRAQNRGQATGFERL